MISWLMKHPETPETVETVETLKHPETLQHWNHAGTKLVRWYTLAPWYAGTL